MFVVIGDILIEVWADFDSVRNMQIGFSLNKWVKYKEFCIFRGFLYS